MASGSVSVFDLVSLLLPVARLFARPVRGADGAVLCLQVAEDLMEQLGVSQDRLVTGAYVDLLLANQPSSHQLLLSHSQ